MTIVKKRRIGIGTKRTNLELIASEEAEQKALVKWLQLKNYLFFHINNSSNSIIHGKKLKSLGVRAGVSDIFICHPTSKYAGLFIEMKKRIGGIVSVDQQEFLERVNKLGYYGIVANGCEEAMRIIEKYFKSD